MASSQVEIAASNPFGCVLRDHNRRDRRSRESNALAAFQINLKDLVRDHLQSCCISAPPRKSDSDSNSSPISNLNSSSNSHSHRPTSVADSWAHKEQENDNYGGHHKKLKIRDRWARAREMVFASEKQSPEKAFVRESSPAAHTDSSVEIPHLGGVSSLVQKWRDFEVEAKSLNSCGNCNGGSPASSRSNSGSTSTEKQIFIEIPPINPEACWESVDENFGTPTMTEDSFGDWESDRKSPSGPPSARGRDSDATERERLRVADIIRKLTSVDGMQQQYGEDINFGTSTKNNIIIKNNNDHEQRHGTHVSLARIQTSSDQQQEHRFVFSPKIRGRQAFSDLLMQMERDRQRELEGLAERKAVSKFSHRGRIQALLRVRFLHRQADVRDQKSSKLTSQSNKPGQGSAIMHLRERFSTGAEHGAAEGKHRCREVVDHNRDSEKSLSSNRLKETADNTPNLEKSSSPNQLKLESHQHEVTESRSPCSKSVDNTSNMESSSTSKRLKEPIPHERLKASVQQNTPEVQNSRILHEEAGPSPNVTCKTSMQKSSPEEQNSRIIHEEAGPSPDVKGTNYEDEDSRQHQPEDKETPLNGWESNKEAGDQEDDSHQFTESTHEWINANSVPQRFWAEQEANHGQQFMETSRQWVSDVCHSQDEWEEEEYYDQLYETDHDWITDVSRPRSDWESLRKARYQEMLDPYLDNGDIRQLLERKSVSSFLSSGLRERIDRLMISRTQVQPHPARNLQAEEEYVEKENKLVEEEDKQEEDKDEENDIEVVDESTIRQQYGETGEYFDDTTSSLSPPSPSSLRSWSCNRDPEVSDDSDRVASPSLQQSSSSNSYSQNNRQCSTFMNHSSIEMELIHDLRGHMQQLHQEMSELRKSIMSCMDMQVKMQRSMKKDSSGSVSHSARKEGKVSLSKVQSNGGCCVCFEMQVDCVLYRCGHMCTCFKCAHELQWGSGKCPICQAPILDVVRTQANYK